jgi:hypothetical protein
MFLTDGAAFLEAYPLVRPSQIGKLAVGDPGLVRQPRAGRSPREATAAKVRAWMAGYAEVERARTPGRTKARRTIESLSRTAA